MTHPYWEFDACGVVSSWELRIATEGDIELQIWRVLDVDQREAEMMGYSTHHGNIAHDYLFGNPNY